MSEPQFSGWGLRPKDLEKDEGSLEEPPDYSGWSGVVAALTILLTLAGLVLWAIYGSWVLVALDLIFHPPLGDTAVAVGMVAIVAIMSGLVYSALALFLAFILPNPLPKPLRFISLLPGVLALLAGLISFIGLFIAGR